MASSISMPCEDCIAMMWVVELGSRVCITVVFTDLRPVCSNTDLRNFSASLRAYWQFQIERQEAK